MSGFEEGLGKENARQGISVEVVGGRFSFFVLLAGCLRFRLATPPFL
ncbi:hypothetical protein [Secundilactobacillus similis]|nr:hypothetical protein [Secundilactobacillus similis]